MKLVERPSRVERIQAIQEALLALIGETGASKEDFKKLLRTHAANDFVTAVNGLLADGVIAYDYDAEKYGKPEKFPLPKTAPTDVRWIPCPKCGALIPPAYWKDRCPVCYPPVEEL